MHTVRQPAVAGAFYPGERDILAGALDRFLSASGTGPGDAPPKAVIVPHAGYIYSGQTAAFAYARLSVGRKSIRRVILLGPVHRMPVRGLALPGVDTFATPLGEVEIDASAIQSLAGMKQIVVSAPAHAWEHSLEVQVPFLQTVLDDFKLAPLAVGDATPLEVAEVLDVLWGGAETVIVVSSDLSHFLSYTAARAADQETVENILGLKGALTHHQACGGTPVNGLILAARKHHLCPQLLNLCNSGDTAGDKNRVVGYASIMFTEAPDDVKHA